MRNRSLAGLAGLVLAAMLGASGPALAEMVSLTGEVTYRERIALPPAATLRIRLIDMTAAGTPTRVEAEAPITGDGKTPLTFTLDFDDRAIDPAHRHALVAEISAGVELWFRNAPPYAVDPLAPEAPVTIVADFVGRLAEPVPPPPTPGPDETPPASLFETTWRAAAIGGTPVLANTDSTLSIERDLRVGGRGGCNSYFAQAAIAGESLRFSAVAATRAACLSEAATAQETSFFEALGATRFWRFEGERLVLLDANGTELVHFSRVAR